MCAYPLLKVALLPEGHRVEGLLVHPEDSAEIVVEEVELLAHRVQVGARRRHLLVRVPSTARRRHRKAARHMHSRRVDKREQTSESRQATGDRREQTSESRQARADKREQTGESRQARADRRQETGESRQARADTRDDGRAQMQPSRGRARAFAGGGAGVWRRTGVSAGRHTLWPPRQRAMRSPRPPRWRAGARSLAGRPPSA